nr:unnamed protein product [Callosobruchus chinensis]
MNNQALPRSHSFKLLGVSITENMIWHELVASIATAAGKKLGYLFRARKYFSPFNLLTLYKAQIRPSLEYCSHYWEAAAVQKRAIRLIGDPALTCHLQPLSHRRAVDIRFICFSFSFHNINAGVPQGSVLAPTLFLLHINDLLSSTTNPIHSFADDSTLHAGIMSNKPISVVELERRRLATAASLGKDLEAITAWGLTNMVECNACKTQYCTLSSKRCTSEHSVLMNNQALPRSHSFKLLGSTAAAMGRLGFRRSTRDLNKPTLASSISTSPGNPRVHLAGLESGGIIEVISEEQNPFEYQ